MKNSSSNFDTSTSSITAAALKVRRQRSGGRSQADRSAEMRLRILEAAVKSFAIYGYNGTSFTTITKLAGISRGALQHHYPEKRYVIAGTIEYLVEKVVAKIGVKLDSGKSDQAKMQYVFDQIWNSTISTPFTILSDVRIAARTNPALREMFVPFEREIRMILYSSIANAVGNNYSHSKTYSQRIEGILSTMRGLALQLSYGWDRNEIEAIWQVSRDDFIAGFLTSI
jgi:AcrR family transcriptional regulator